MLHLPVRFSSKSCPVGFRLANISLLADWSQLIAERAKDLASKVCRMPDCKMVTFEAWQESLQ